MDCRTHERSVGMLNTPYVKKDTIKNFFPVPNAVFDLGLHHMEINIYAYLLRIEDRRTYQCLVSYPTIARKLGISVNTVAKYVAALEEHGLIRTEHTEIITKDGHKRNGCLRYTILPIKNALDLCYKRQLEKAEQRLPDMRFHDLRHTFATHALTSGVDAKTLSGILGHTKTSFTLDTYTHVTGDMHRKASGIVSEFMNDFVVKE